MNYKEIMPARQEISHKGTFGKVLNIAGSVNFQGAAFLSSVCALKIGAGYVTLACPKEIIPTVASLSPDITFVPLGGTILSDLEVLKARIFNFDVVSMGCGIGLSDRTVFFVEKLISFLCDFEKVVVLDADALNVIVLSGVKSLPKNSIITPHEAEMARLMHISVSEVSNNRVEVAKAASAKFNCTVVLKGHGSVICDAEQNVVMNNSGNSALAKAGTGDVLTGVISGLAAQGCSAFDAAKLGCYIHGRSGELASFQLSEYSVLASNLIDFIPVSINELYKS